MVTKMELLLLLIAVFAIDESRGICATCKSTYETALGNAAGNAAPLCTAATTAMTCFDPLTDLSCTDVDATYIGNIKAVITNQCTSPVGSICTCQQDHITRFAGGAAGSATECTSLYSKLSCIGGKTTVACDASALGHTLAGSADTRITAIGTGTCGTPTDTCTCEKTYALADISTDKCTPQKTYINCLYDKTSVGCASSTVIALATAAESDGVGTCSGFATSSCSCILAYAKADISIDVIKCTEKKKLVTCLLGKGAGCVSGTTATSIATPVIDTDIPAITSPTQCALTAGTCLACESAYAKADISTAALHCTALGTFVDCMKKKTETTCSGAAATTLGTVAATNYATLTAQCVITGKVCECEVDYIKSDYAQACTVEKTLVSCLKGRLGANCKGDSTGHALAIAAHTEVTNIGGCATTETVTCACEAAYSKTDITGGTTAECDAAGTFIDCLKDKTLAGCVASDSVSTLATFAESKMTGHSCSTTACTCLATYTKATRSSGTNRCTAAKTLISCVKGLNVAGCYAGHTPSSIATFAEGVISTDCVSPDPTDTCTCEIAYAKVDQSGGADCPGKLAYMDCLSKAYGAGCDGTARHVLAAAANLDISACSPQALCNCQTTYARADSTNDATQCSAIAAYLSCLDGITTETACVAGSTVQSLATHAEGRVSLTSGCSLLGACQCQATFLKATRSNNAERCSALKAKLHCLVRTRSNGCDGTTTRDAVVTSIKTLNVDPAYSTCTYSTACSTCMIVYGETPYAGAAHCPAVNTLMNCLYGQDLTTNGCDDSTVLTAVVGEFETTDATCTSAFSETCKCEITYMKAPGTDSGTICTAQKTLLHCLDGTVDANCDASSTRDVVATVLATAASGCITAATATCSTCQKDYAVTALTSHCDALRKKLGCLSGEKSIACDEATQPHTLASSADTLATGLAGCPATITDTCSCEITLAKKDIQVNTNFCTGLKDLLSCLRGKTNTGCETATTVTALDLSAKQEINTLAGDCPVTATCTCEVNYATATLTTADDKCTAALAEAVCLYGKTATGCNGATRDEVYWTLLAWMDTVTTAGGATTAKCTTDPVCLCEIAYAAAAKSTNGEKCSAYKNLIVCLEGKTGTGCDGTSTVINLATTAESGITALGTTDCPVPDPCQCQINFAKADISDATKTCTEQKKKMECLYDSTYEHMGCDGSTKSAIATALETAGSTCFPTTTEVCKTCMVAYAKSTVKCTGLGVLLDCYFTLNQANSVLNSCDDTKAVPALATTAETAWGSCTNTDACTCISTFAKSSRTCNDYLTGIDCFTATATASCAGTDRQTIAATFDADMATACTTSTPLAGTVCVDCEIPYMKIASTCTALKTYYNCLFGLRSSGSSCVATGAKTIKQLADEQETQFATTLSCNAGLEDACKCQKDYVQTGDYTCANAAVAMNCLWISTAVDCGGSTKRHIVATAIDTNDIDSTCRTSTLSDVCKCQITYAKVDMDGTPPLHCNALQAELHCLETITGSGCETSRTLRDVATDAKTKIDADNTCTPTDTCVCQAEYLVADISTSTCPATENKIACLYATTTMACDNTSPRTSIMANTDAAVAGACSSLSDSCKCQHAYGKDTSSNECSYQYGVIKCLQTALDAGCTGLTAPFTKTRTQLGTDAETYVGANGCNTPRREPLTGQLSHLRYVQKTAPTDVCTCQITFAKASVSPATDLCTAYKQLILCVAGEAPTVLGCDGSDTPVSIATAAETGMATIRTTVSAATCPVTDSCQCEIDYAKDDISDPAKKCTALHKKMECLYKASDVGCDGTTKRSALATAVETELGSCSATTTNPCSICMIPYAKVDVSVAADKCTGLGVLVDCLGGLTAAQLAENSCDGSRSVAQLATAAEADWGSCTARTDACNCILTFAKAGVDCGAAKTQMDCLVATTSDSCSGTGRETIAGTAETQMAAICSAARPAAGTACIDCLVVYAKAAPACAALTTYYGCLFGKRAAGTSCDASKTIKQLVDEQEATFTALTCTALDDACQCQKNYLQAAGGVNCNNAAVALNCLWATTGNDCDGTKRHVAATAIDGTDCVTTTLSAVCQCQVAYAKVDPAGAHCTALKTELQCLETITGTGCETSRTIRDVATDANTKIDADNTCINSKVGLNFWFRKGTESSASVKVRTAPTATCDCQRAYLAADISSSACPAREKKIACLYATDTAACDGTTARTVIMTNTDALAGTCSTTSSCTCQANYGKATASTECLYKLGVITCLQTTVDTGCIGESAHTKTRTALATDVETYVTGANGCTVTDTCQCQIDYAKATVDPTNPDKCSALATLAACMVGKTDVGCDGTSKPSDLATAADTQMTTDSCPSVTSTCRCQINYAKVDLNVGANKCPGLLDEIECVFGTEDAACDGTTTRHALAATIVAAIGTATCTGMTGTCTTCIYNYAQADLSTTKCASLGALIHCLDGKTATSCKSVSPVSVVTLATNAKTAIDALGGSCTVYTDTCQCQYNFITATTGTDCQKQAARMECLVAATQVACDATTTRAAYTTATAHPALQLVSGCQAGLTTTCTACEIVYAKATSTADTDRCAALKTYYHCLDSQTTTSCDTTKTITQLATEANTRATSDNCNTVAPFGDTCTCQATYLMAAKTDTTLKCTALKNKMSCLATSYDAACDGTTTRDTVATTTSTMIGSESCPGITNVCTCERTYGTAPFPDDTAHCTTLKAAVGCLEGETSAGCGSTATVSTFATAVLTKIGLLTTPACVLTGTCMCQATYLSDDISTPALKCDALEKKQACLYQTNDVACDGTTVRKDVITSVDTEMGSCSIPSTCRCQIEYGKDVVTPDTAKCTAMKTMVHCLQATDDGGCVGPVTATRTQVATSVETFAGGSGDCSILAGCQCQVDYGKADVSDSTKKCTAQKVLVACLGATTVDGCTSIAPHTLAATAVSVIGGLPSCNPAVGTTCKCEMDHAATDRSDLPKACSAAKVMLKCLESSTGVGCAGDSKNTLATRIDTYMGIAGNSCPKTSTCGCQVVHAKANIDASADKCSALKAKIVCLRSTNDVACDTTTTKVAEATSTESTMDAMGDAQCHVEDSCRCEATHAKTDTSTDNCGPTKALLHCLTSTSEGSCTSTKVAVGTAAYSTITTIGSPCTPVTASCMCQKDYVITAATTPTAQCTALKTLVLCLGADNDVACDGTTTKMALAASVEARAKATSPCVITDTCQCEINYAKSDTSSNPLKCSAYYNELTCLFPATSTSCDTSQRSDQVATTVNAASNNAALSCPAKSDECTCATTYATTDITLPADKCTAAKALLSCMSGKTGTGCNGVQAAATILSAAQSAITEASTAGASCALTASCQCEVAYGSADPTTCQANLDYFACLYTVSDVGCSGTTNAALQTQAKNTISTVSGCALPDTCQCQETYRVNSATNTTSAATCRFVKNALACLSSSSENSCDGTQTSVQVTNDFQTQQSGLSGCFVTATCTCQIELGKADITSSINKCTAGSSFMTCLNLVTMNEDVGCDDISTMADLRKGLATSLVGTCTGCSLSQMSFLSSLFLALLAVMLRQ